MKNLHFTVGFYLYIARDHDRYLLRPRDELVAKLLDQRLHIGVDHLLQALAPLLFQRVLRDRYPRRNAGGLAVEVSEGHGHEGGERVVGA